MPIKTAFLCVKKSVIVAKENLLAKQRQYVFDKKRIGNSDNAQISFLKPILLMGWTQIR